MAPRKGSIPWNKGLYKANVGVFWSNVQKSDGCWFWRGFIGKHGYGTFRFGGRHWRAHRLAWEVTNGEIPSGLFVCHHCDTPACVRPDHLFLGTNSENQIDSSRKGRKPGFTVRVPPKKGEASPHAKVTEEDVREIRRLRAAGMTLTNIARRYPIHPMTIGEICRREIWKHVE